jgi:uncharacterized protein (UPF0333 family)
MDGKQVILKTSKWLIGAGVIALMIAMFLVGRVVYIMESKPTVSATITAINESEDDDVSSVVVAYQVGDQLYTSNYNIIFSDSSLGATVKIYYEAADPSRVYQVEMHILFIIPLLLAVLLLAVGIAFFVSIVKPEKRFQVLSESGKRVKATIVKVQKIYTMSISTMRKSYYPTVLVCKVCNEYSGEDKLYKSHYIWDLDEQNIILNQSVIDVWVDSDKSKLHYVDPNSIQNELIDPFNI